jgi:hypothetical protein
MARSNTPPRYHVPGNTQGNIAKPAKDPLAPVLLLRVRQDLRAAFEGNWARPPKKTY